MGEQAAMKRYIGPERPMFARLPARLVRHRPRGFAEWRALRAWRKLSTWEIEPAGYLMRAAREAAGLTQRELAGRLNCSQQAVAQAERWENNPSVDFLRHWARGCDSKLEIDLSTGRAGLPRSRDES